ncbi:hypothetical protein OR573_01210 [Halomonas sp. CH40]
MKKSRLFFWVMNLLAIMLLVYSFGFSTMYYCGRMESKPVLPLGLSPTWFDDRFQINRGYKPIIGSSPESRRQPLYDQWVKGSELFRTIVKYDAREHGVGVYFKAIDWDGVERIFLLRDYAPSEDERYVYEVSPEEHAADDFEWIDVDHLSCLKGRYEGWTYIFVLVIFVMNMVVALKLFLRFAKAVLKRLF